MDVCQWCHDWTRNHSSPKVYFSDWLTWEGGMTKGSDTLSGYPGPCNRCYILYVAPLRGYVKSSPVASYVYIAARKRGRLTQSLHWGATWRTDVNWWTYAVATLDLGEYNRREPIRSTGVTTFLMHLDQPWPLFNSQLNFFLPVFLLRNAARAKSTNCHFMILSAFSNWTDHEYINTL